MKRILMVLAAVSLAASAAIAQESTYDTVVRKFGEAYAIGEKCPSLKVSAEWMSIYSMGFGIAVDEDFKRRMADEADKARATIVDLAPDMACVMGNMLYGKSGTNGPNLLTKE